MRLIISLSRIRAKWKALQDESQNSRFLLSRNQELKRRKRGSPEQTMFKHMVKIKRIILMKYLKTMITETMPNHLSKVAKGKSIKILQTIIMVKTLLMTIHLMQLIKICNLKDRTVSITTKRKINETKKMSIIIMFLDSLRSLLRTILWMKSHLKNKKFLMKKMT